MEYMVLRKKDLVEPDNYMAIVNRVVDDIIGTFYILDSPGKAGTRELMSRLKSLDEGRFKEYFKRSGEVGLAEEVCKFLTSGDEGGQFKICVDFLDGYFQIDTREFIGSYSPMFELINSGIIGRQGSYLENKEWYFYPILPNKVSFLESEYAKMQANIAIFGRNHFADERMLSSHNLSDFNSLDIPQETSQSKFDPLFGALREDRAKISKQKDDI